MIYFIQDEANLNIKIGFTAGEPDGRRRALQTGNADRLVVLHTMPGTEADEGRLHERFAAARVAGEWFRPVPELLQLILTKPAPAATMPAVVPWPLTFYLAGKINGAGWRGELVQGELRGLHHHDPIGQGVEFVGDCCGETGDEEWKVLHEAIFDTHHYSGPYFANCGHGCNYRDDQHGWIGSGATFKHGGEESSARETLIANCLTAINRADVLFAWIDSPDCYGTVAEIGYAKGVGKRVYVTGPRYFRDMWFLYEMADDFMGCTQTPEFALRLVIKDMDERRLVLASQGNNGSTAVRR